jgi:predicted DNA-binding protein
MSKTKKSAHGQYRPFNAVRVPADLFERLKKIADHNDRTTTREVTRAIKEYLDKYEKTLPPSGEP